MPERDFPDETFDKRQRLLKRVDFRQTERKGFRRGGKYFVIIARKNGFDFSRLGITVTRKVGNAVTRNRWKRRVREIFRRNKRLIPSGLDLVVIVRRENDDHPPFDALQSELLALSQSVVSKREAR